MTAEHTYVFEPGPVPTVPVAGTDGRFPVRRIYCVGRNYAAHAREMGRDPDREPPFFFMKPADSVVPGGGVVKYPPGTSDLHHEIELVVGLHRGGKDIAASEALDCVYGYAVGLDAIAEMDYMVRVDGLTARAAAQGWMATNAPRVESWFEVQ